MGNLKKQIGFKVKQKFKTEINDNTISMNGVAPIRENEGYKNIGFAHFNYINPMPKNTEEILSKFKKIVVCELNNGQFASILKIKFSSFEFLQFNKIQGLPFANDDLIQKFKELV